MQMPFDDHKLIVTIVKKGHAKKVVHYIRLKGVTGSTIIPAEGVRKQDKLRMFGLPIKREREVIFTVVDEKILKETLLTIKDTAVLGKDTPGIAVVIDVKKVLGVMRLNTGDIADVSRKGANQSMEALRFDLIVSIVNSGEAEAVIEAAKKQGADGGTIIRGRGTGVHEQQKLFNILIEPEKDIVLTLIEKGKTDDVLHSIKEDCGLNQPGKGIAFVLETEQSVGLTALIQPDR